ncbi:uncharacterized protein BDR25DRAFT_351668 [Lindgomyces ingoldianus]|uniref:Uncharacterized protein n=1 Tax=Lindgomyces ingoldianus TaxID=673940 RepID=A0ACB6R5S7_9PLEO|nr:uncharacterized protein BDR25DRAFT_351668 [Lindgomyces ingoldianus]KAF2474130.1 hypothetical protein BDR25DRAFT_351668 [Lindgomyces ingoldianus]
MIRINGGHTKYGVKPTSRQREDRCNIHFGLDGEVRDPASEAKKARIAADKPHRHLSTSTPFSALRPARTRTKLASSAMFTLLLVYHTTSPACPSDDTSPYCPGTRRLSDPRNLSHSYHNLILHCLAFIELFNSSFHRCYENSLLHINGFALDTACSSIIVLEIYFNYCLPQTYLAQFPILRGGIHATTLFLSSGHSANSVAQFKFVIASFTHHHGSITTLMLERVTITNTETFALHGQGKIPRLAIHRAHNGMLSLPTERGSSLKSRMSNDPRLNPLHWCSVSLELGVICAQTFESVVGYLNCLRLFRQISYLGRSNKLRTTNQERQVPAVWETKFLGFLFRHNAAISLLGSRPFSNRQPSARAFQASCAVTELTGCLVFKHLRVYPAFCMPIFLHSITSCSHSFFHNVAPRDYPSPPISEGATILHDAGTGSPERFPPTPLIPNRHPAPIRTRERYPRFKQESVKQEGQVGPQAQRGFASIGLGDFLGL